MVATPKYDLSTDTTLGGNSPSDIISPSEKAIKTYVDAHSGGANVEAYTSAEVDTIWNSVTPTGT